MKNLEIELQLTVYLWLALAAHNMLPALRYEHHLT